MLDTAVYREKAISFKNSAIQSTKEILIEIPLSVRLIMILYFFLYELLVPIKSLASPGGLEPEYIVFVILHIIVAFLILAPVMIRFEGIGLLHPFVWPAIFRIAKGYKDLGEFFTPFFMDQRLYEVSSHFSYANDIIDANFRNLTLQVISLACLYLAYYLTGLRRKQKFFKFSPKPVPDNIVTRIIIWSGIAAAMSMAFFISQGGIKAWMNSWGIAGRAEAEEGKGPILSFISSLYYIPVIWFIVKGKEVFRNPMFYILMGLFTLASFAATGSRYGVLQSVTVFLMAFIYMRKEVPIIKMLAGAVGFFILFGILGMLRTSATSNKSDVDWALLSKGDISGYFQYAADEGAKRAAENPDIAILQKVPKSVDYLYGQSFLNILTTFVPRAIWSDKPHSGSYYTGQLIFGVEWGIPPTEIGEVYWNFGYIGFILMFLLKGYFFRVLVNTFKHYHEAPAVMIIYFIFLFAGTGLDSLSLSDFLRKMLFIFIGFKVLKLL